MRHFTQGRFARQVRFLRQRFLQDGDFASRSRTCSLRKSSRKHSPRLLHAGTTRIFTHTRDTSWVFLGQVLCRRPVPPCRKWPGRLHIASRRVLDRAARRREPIAGEETPARTILLSSRACKVGQNSLDARRVASQWPWKRPPRVSVRRLDGLHARHHGESQEIPSDLQSEAGDVVPLSHGLRPHFAVVWSDPQARDLGYAGKGQSELGMVRMRASGACFAAATSWWRIKLDVCLDRDGDAPATRYRLASFASHPTASADFRRGMRLEKDDHIVKWMKPRKPRSIDRKTYDALPEFLLVRECRIRIERPGFRVRCLVIATTLLDCDDSKPIDWALSQRKTSFRPDKACFIRRSRRDATQTCEMPQTEVPPNDKAQRPVPPLRHHAARDRNAAHVCCSDLVGNASLTPLRLAQGRPSRLPGRRTRPTPDTSPATAPNPPSSNRRAADATAIAINLPLVEVFRVEASLQFFHWDGAEHVRDLANLLGIEAANRPIARLNRRGRAAEDHVAERRRYWTGRIQGGITSEEEVQGVPRLLQPEDSARGIFCLHFLDRAWLIARQCPWIPVRQLRYSLQGPCELVSRHPAVSRVHSHGHFLRKSRASRCLASYETELILPDMFRRCAECPLKYGLSTMLTFRTTF